MYSVMKILIINGPNLNLLGVRTPNIYGNMDMETYLTTLRKRVAPIEIDLFQSNIEGEIVDALHSAVLNYNGVILNAGGYTHTSVAIADGVAAVMALKLKVVEVHISNITAREPFRHTSLIAPVASGTIFGFGLMGYELAAKALERNTEQ